MASCTQSVEAGSDDLAENAEINVTTFIDVMLVLLIIFMVAAPLATVDINIDLPAATATPPPAPDKQPLSLTLRADRGLLIGTETVFSSELIAAIANQTEGNKESRIMLRADEEVAYEHLMAIMNLLRTVGYLKITLVGPLQDLRAKKAVVYGDITDLPSGVTARLQNVRSADSLPAGDAP